METSNPLATTSGVDTSLPAIISLIKEFQNQSPFKDQDTTQKKLGALQEILRELEILSEGFKRIDSGEIKFEEHFLPRRKKFKDEFKMMIEYNIFPTFFQIDRISIEQLYNFAQKDTSLNALRFYPISDDLLINSTKYSYAFMWANTNSLEDSRVNTNFIIDIIDPCPPGNCDKVDL